MACAVIAWSSEDKTPLREVTEVVSVVYKPARQVPSDFAVPVDPEIAITADQLAAVPKAMPSAMSTATTATTLPKTTSPALPNPAPAAVVVAAAAAAAATTATPTAPVPALPSSASSRQWVQARGAPVAEQAKTVSACIGLRVPTHGAPLPHRNQPLRSQAAAHLLVLPLRARTQLNPCQDTDPLATQERLSHRPPPLSCRCAGWVFTCSPDWVPTFRSGVRARMLASLQIPNGTAGPRRSSRCSLGVSSSSVTSYEAIRQA